MLVMKCAACGESVSVDETRGSGQSCPRCGESVGRLPKPEGHVSTALDDLRDDPPSAAPDPPRYERASAARDEGRGVRNSSAADGPDAGVEPVSFGAYGKAADALWDDPTAAHHEEQIAGMVANEAMIDEAVVNEVPADVQARFEARQRDQRKKMIKIGMVVAVAVIGLVVFILY